MEKIGLLFAGQGAQQVGMGRELYEQYDCVRELFHKADALLDFSVSKMCFEGPESDLSKTEFTQPCMYTVAAGITSVLLRHGIHADFCAGLSLGEYSALCYAGVISFEDGLTLLRRRGGLMQHAMPEGVGAMAAVIGLENSILENYILGKKQEGILEIANYNCPGQTVITGQKALVEKAVLELKALGAMKVVLLNVSGAFHSSLLKAAGEELEKELLQVRFHKPNCKVISNFDNEYYTEDANTIIYKLKQQLTGSVRLEENIRKQLQDGARLFIEIGPGKTMAGFVRKIDRGIKVYSVEDVKSMEKLLAEL